MIEFIIIKDEPLNGLIQKIDESIVFIKNEFGIELKSYEAKQEAVRIERSERYSQSIEGTKEAINDIHDLLRVVENRLDRIQTEINGNSKNLAIQEFRIEAIEKDK